jgi:hypothetical protein
VKYIIPRNKLIPDPSFEDILNSGPSFKDTEGKPIGDPGFLYRGSDRSLPKSAMLPEGQLFWFNLGQIFLPNKAKTYFDLAVESLKIGTTIVLGGAFESVVGELPIYLAALVHTGIEHTLFPEKEHAAPKANPGVADLVSKGALYLPAVQMVEVEHQVIPRVLRKPEHRIFFTYERLDGERTTYGLRFFSSLAPDVFDGMISFALRARRRGEFGQLASIIKTEQFNGDAVLASYIEKYQSRYGAEWQKHAVELLAEVNQACDEELERKGFTKQNLYAAVLERIAPLLPYYRQVPELRDEVRILEEKVGNQQVAAP